MPTLSPPFFRKKHPFLQSAALRSTAFSPLPFPGEALFCKTPHPAACVSCCTAAADMTEPFSAYPGSSAAPAAEQPGKNTASSPPTVAEPASRAPGGASSAPRSSKGFSSPLPMPRLRHSAPPARPPEPSGLPRSADIAPTHPCRGPDVTKKAGHGSNRQERERNISSSCGPGGLCFLHAGTLPSPLILWRHPCHIPSLSLLFPAALC